MNKDAAFLKLCDLLASKSPDPSRKTGAVIVDYWGDRVVASGFNHIPGDLPATEARLTRPAKYKWIEHAERGAIYACAAEGVPTAGCKMYLTWYPCADCARAIVFAKISELVCREPDWNDPKYDFEISREMLAEAGVVVRFVGKYEEVPA